MAEKTQSTQTKSDDHKQARRQPAAAKSGGLGVAEMDGLALMPGPQSMKMLGHPGILGAQRQQTAENLSDLRGNRALQNTIRRAPAPSPARYIQRQTPPPAQAGWGQKHTFKSPKLEVPVKRGLGPVQLESIAASGEFGFEIWNPGQEAGAAPGSGSTTQGRVGSTGEVGKSAGVQAELQKSWEDTAIQRATGFQPSLKGGGELTTAGGEVGIEGQMEGKNVTFALKFTIIGDDFEKGQIEFATLTATAQFPVTKGERTLADGTKVKYELVEKNEFKFQPNYAQIGKWLAQRFATAAAGELIITGAFIAGGVFIVVGTVSSLADADDLSRIPDEVSAKVSGYAHGYEDAMRGQESGGNLPGYGQGYAEGQTKYNQAKQKVPEAVLKEEAKNKSLWAEGVGAFMPRAKEECLRKWEEDHWFDTNLGGGYGYRRLRAVLGALIIRP